MFDITGEQGHADLVEWFCSLNPSMQYPAKAQVWGAEAERVRKGLARRFGLPEHWSAHEQTCAIWKLGIDTGHRVREGEAMPIQRWLQLLGIQPKDTIYVNWPASTRSDPYDVFDIQSFEDALPVGLWRPLADDIELFDDSFDWVLLINHEGYVGCARPQPLCGT